MFPNEFLGVYSSIQTDISKLRNVNRVKSNFISFLSVELNYNDPKFKRLIIHSWCKFDAILEHVLHFELKSHLHVRVYLIWTARICLFHSFKFVPSDLKLQLGKKKNSMVVMDLGDTKLS